MRCSMHNFQTLYNQGITLFASYIISANQYLGLPKLTPIFKPYWIL